MTSWSRFHITVALVLRRHWRKALLWRERIRPSEEALHLLMAGLIGILAGGVNLLFFAFRQLLEMLMLGDMGDVVSIARGLSPWYRLAGPTVGGLVAGTWEKDDERLRVAWIREAGAVPSAALEAEVGRLAATVGRDLRLEVAPA